MKCMRFYNIHFRPLFTYLALISLTTSSTPLVSNPLPKEDGGGGCEMVACGHGNCKASNNSLLGYECECHPGWTKFRIGHFVFPSCVIPNCTFNFPFFNESRRPPSPLFLPPLNFSDPCGLIWCGRNGRCVTNGTKYSCQCLQGSANVFNLTALPCFNRCYLGEDCNNVFNGIIGPPIISSPPSSPLPPHVISNSSERNGFPAILKIIQTVILTLLVVSSFAT